jgi:AraC family transcriptional regulator
LNQYKGIDSGTPMVEKLGAGRYFGHLQGSREVAGLTFTESVYPRDCAIPAHRHEHAFFYLIVEGCCAEVCGREKYSGGPPTLVFHPPGEVHANHWHGAGGRCFHIEIAHSRLEYVRQYSTDLDRSARLQGGLPNWLALRLYREYRRWEGVSTLAMEGLALELLAELSRHDPPATDRDPPPWLRRVSGLLHDRFAEGLSLDVVAAEAGVHPAHLARVFRRHYGCTVGDYVRRLRVEDSCRRLATSDAPMVMIALDAGFADQSHFAKAFRRQTGMTPAEYRRSLRPRKSETN